MSAACPPVKRASLEAVPRDRDYATLAERFERALDGIWIALQPIVRTGVRGGAPCLTDVRPFGHEALLRSDEPTLARPLDLIAAAEQLGELVRLSRRVRDATAATFARGPVDTTLFVNLHAGDLLDETLYAEGAPLAAFADRVVLEITERATLDGVRDLDDRIARLRRLGYRIAVDDLGAGFSSLSCLDRIAPDVVKVDMSLVRDCDRAPKRRLILEALLGLCRSLGVPAVAEGVETEEEHRTLVHLGAELLQGYRFGRPTRNF